MLSLKSPELSQAQPPQFIDAKSCRRWLAALPLANTHLAHAEIATQLGLLNGYAIDPAERLQAMEALREPVAFLQQEMAKEYVGRAMPLDLPQQAVWNSANALWRAMSIGYLLCLQGFAPRGQGESGRLALICHRCLRYTGLQIAEHYHAFRQVPGELWRQLHDLYSFAEEQGLAERAVEDALNRQTSDNHCMAAYTRPLMLDLADPYRRSPRQLVMLERWLEKWAGRVEVRSEPPTDTSLSLVGVDLEGVGGPTILHHSQPMQRPRYLDTERFGATFRKRIKALRKGDDPERIGLGADCTQPGCEALLVELYRHWCEAVVRHRAFNRRPGVAQAQVAFGMQTIHFFMGGEKPFRQPGEAERLSRRELEDLALFGRVSGLTEKMRVSQLGFALETWQILDESALGFRLARREGAMRLGHNQLLAVRPSDSKHFALGAVKWLIFTLDGELHVGVRTLPGAPLAVAARPATLTPATAGKFVQAFLLPEMPVLRETASLVLPRGWFHPGRVLEIHSDRSEMVRLHALIEAGSDYERVGFVKV